MNSSEHSWKNLYSTEYNSILTEQYNLPNYNLLQKFQDGSKLIRR